jgi:hypothetical protein
MKIEKCPFCGGKARWMYLKPIGRVMCKKCGASSAALSDNYEEADCQQEAIAAWNRRSDAVPVVRCGECDRRIKSADLTNTVLCGWLHKITMNKDDFCSYGAKMEDKPCE